MSRPKIKKDPRYLAFVVQTLLEIKLAYGKSDEWLERHFSIAQCAAGRQWRRYKVGNIPHQTFLRICHQAIAEKRMKFSLGFLRCATAEPYHWQRKTEYDEQILHETRNHSKAFEKAVRHAFSKCSRGKLAPYKIPRSRQEAEELTVQHLTLAIANILQMDTETLLSALSRIDAGAPQREVHHGDTPDF